MGTYTHTQTHTEIFNSWFAPTPFQMLPMAKTEPNLSQEPRISSESPTWAARLQTHGPSSAAFTNHSWADRKEVKQPKTSAYTGSNLTKYGRKKPSIHI